MTANDAEYGKPHAAPPDKTLIAFPPVADSRSRVLLLGSMPSERSLRLGQYYGHPRNHFWPLVYGLFGQSADPDYAARLAFALNHGLALWDVLHACEREGSLDADIVRPVANDFAAWLRLHPGIRHLFFNGTAAEKLFRRLVLPGLDRSDLALHLLPSSSPARTLAFADKLAAWQAVKQALQES